MRAKVGNHLYTSLGNGDSSLGHFRQVLKVLNFGHFY